MPDPLAKPPSQFAAPQVPGQVTAPGFAELYGKGAGIMAKPVGSDPISQLGNWLFGKGAGTSGIGNIPVVGDLGRWIGAPTGGDSGLSGLAALAVKPIEAAAKIASSIPIGWIPGGADAKFEEMGAWQKQNDPAAYAQWLVAKDTANADFFDGGNQRAAFTREWGKKYLEQSYDGPQGLFQNDTSLMFGPAGSLGGAVVDGFHLMGLPGLDIQAGLANNKDAAKGGLDRIDQIVDAARRGKKLNPQEAMVVDKLQAGEWSKEHAKQYIVENFQGLSRDFLTQMVGSLVTDPTLILSLGAGALVKVGATGARVAESALEAENIIQRMGVTLNAVQKSSLAPVFKSVRTLVDPFTLIGTTPFSRGSLDLTSGAAVRALERTYSPEAYNDMFHLADQLGILDEFRSAVGTGSANAARKWVILQHRITALASDGNGEQLMSILPGDLVDTLMRVVDKDGATRLTEFMTSVKKLFISEEDSANLVRRLNHAFPQAEDWAARVSKMSDDAKSLMHLVTYNATFKRFRGILDAIDGYEGKLPLKNMVLLNDNQLDNVSAQLFEKEFLAAADGAEKMAVWNKAADKWGDIADLGRATESKIDQSDLAEKLRVLIGEPDDYGVRHGYTLHTRVTPDDLKDPSLKPLQDFLDGAGVEGERIWNLGFRPDDLDAWGMPRNAEGKLRAGRDPFVENVIDAPLAYQPVNMTIRNMLGQVIGVSNAAKLAKPVEAIEVAIKTTNDLVSGQRILQNMEQRFVRNMGKRGVGPGVTRDLFKAAKELAGQQGTTLQGVNPENIWKGIEDILPSDLKAIVTKREFMDDLLDASAGDLRIMGVTSGFTQRVRNRLRALGDESNMSGRMTVTLYRQLRFEFNPTFFIQKITDSAYFNILKGVHVVGGSPFKQGTKLAEMQDVLDAIGETGFARAAAFDMREYQLISDTQARVLQKLGIATEPRFFQRIRQATTRWQINNQTSNMEARIGDIVKDSLNEARGEFERAIVDPLTDPAERELMVQALNSIRTWDSLAAHYSGKAGRILSDSEIGMKYMQEIFHDSMGQKLTKEGLLEFRESIKSGVFHKPINVGEMHPLQLNYLAAELGYVDDLGHGDVAKLMRDVTRTSGKAEGSIENVGQLKEMLQGIDAHPDYINRATKALQFNWNYFWKDTRLSLDLSRKDTVALENLIGREAYARGMTGAEYVSQVLITTVGEEGLTPHMSRLLTLVKEGMTGSREEQASKLAAVWINTLDPSGQKVMLQNFRHVLPDLIAEEMAKGTPEGIAAAESMRGVLRWLHGEAMDPNSATSVANGIPQTVAETMGTPAYADTSHAISFKQFDDEGVFDAAGKQVVSPIISLKTDSFWGEGIKALPEDQQRVVVGTIAMLRQMFPEVNLTHVDIHPNFHLSEADGGLGQAGNIGGITVGYSTGETTILLSPNGKWHDPAEFALRREQRLAHDAAFRARTEADVKIDDSADLGVPYLTNPTPEGLIAHEFGHAVDEHIMEIYNRLLGDPTPRSVLLAKKYDRYVEVRNQFISTFFGPESVSDYSAKNRYEFAAELFALAFDPNADEEMIKRYPIALRQGLDDTLTEFRVALEETGLYQPAAVGSLGSAPAVVRNTTTAASTKAILKRIYGSGYTGGASAPRSSPFHGTAEPFTAFDPVLQDASGLYGPGVYLTDKPGVAQGYAELRSGRAGGGAVLNVDIKPNAKLLDAEAPLPDEVIRALNATEPIDALSMIRSSLESQRLPSRDVDLLLSRFEEGVNSGKPLARIYDGFPTGSAFYIAGLKTQVNEILERAGYDGLTHVGGAHFGKETHNVTVLFQANSAIIRPTAAARAGRLNSIPDFLNNQIGSLNLQIGTASRDFAAWSKRWTEELAAGPTRARQARLAQRKAETAQREFDSLTNQYSQLRAKNPEYDGFFQSHPGAPLGSPDGIRFTDTSGPAPVHAVGTPGNDPDLEAVLQHFSKWSQDFTSAHFKADRSQIGNMVRDLTAAIPTDNAVTYKRSEGLVEQLLKQKIHSGQRDAYRLAEMSTQRTMGSRSLNHPVFGMYPTSYMWGKVLPEMTKFLAKDFFGLETSAGGYALMKVEAQIAAQREFDPKFATAADAVGNSEVAFLADYLTPSLPWSEMRGATAPWAQVMAKQGLDPMAMLNAETATISPQRWYKSLLQGAAEIGDAARAAAGAIGDNFNQPPPDPNAVPPTPAQAQLQQQVIPSQQQAGGQTPPIPASGASGALQAPLTDALTELTNIFSSK